jgi:hypothetical protein
MDELSASAAHEAAHAAAALLSGLKVEGAVVNQRGRGGGVTTMNANGNAEGLAVSIAAGLLSEGEAPSWPPSKTSVDNDECQLAKIADTLGLDEAGWARLMAKAVDLTQQSTFTSLKGAIELLLRKHGAVSESQLQRLLAATKTKDEDMYDEERANQRDPDGVLSDEACDYATEYSRSIWEAQPVLHSSIGDEPECFEEIKAKAYNQILAVNQAA